MGSIFIFAGRFARSRLYVRLYLALRDPSNGSPFCLRKAHRSPDSAWSLNYVKRYQQNLMVRTGMVIDSGQGSLLLK